MLDEIIDMTLDIVFMICITGMGILFACILGGV